MSRQTMARRILSGRAPNDFSQSGHRLSQLQDTHPTYSNKKYEMNKSLAESKKLIDKHNPKTKSEIVYKSFPAYKPMHVEVLSKLNT